MTKCPRQPNKQWRSPSNRAALVLNVEAADLGDDLVDRGLHEHDGSCQLAQDLHQVHHPLEIRLALAASGWKTKFFGK